jgi:hypothetical protein
MEEDWPRGGVRGYSAYSTLQFKLKVEPKYGDPLPSVFMKMLRFLV